MITDLNYLSEGLSFNYKHGYIPMDKSPAQQLSSVGFKRTVQKERRGKLLTQFKLGAERAKLCENTHWHLGFSMKYTS